MGLLDLINAGAVCIDKQVRVMVRTPRGQRTPGVEFTI